MTDRTDHYAAAERMLAYAKQTGELTSIAYAAVHALLAIHDTLTALKPEPATYPRPSGPVTMTHPWPPWPSTLPGVDAAARYAANEERQREEAEPDPLDEDDHRDRQDRDGMRLTRVAPHHWHPSSGARCGLGCNGLSLANWNSSYGPLAFAPEPPPDAAHDDLTASEGESGPVEGEGADDAPEALLCPECGDHINTHNMNGCRFVLCACPRTPEDVARALIADAVKAERGGRRG